MPEVTVNRRASPRYPIVLTAEITEPVSGACLSVRTGDLSRGGCYVDTMNPFPPGTPIRIKLSQGGESFEDNAWVIYASPGLGMGVHFAEPIPPQQLAVLERWLEQAARDSA
jgi:hypothetical protein